MALITTDEAKEYLRIDSDDEDATIGILLNSAEKICIGVARFTDEQWEQIDSDAEKTDDYTEAQLKTIRQTMKTAILYALAYLFEHREDADHNMMLLTLRALLFELREGVI